MRRQDSSDEGGQRCLRRRSAQPLAAGVVRKATRQSVNLLNSSQNRERREKSFIPCFPRYMARILSMSGTRISHFLHNLGYPSRNSDWPEGQTTRV
jgi:hypothetical protein